MGKCQTTSSPECSTILDIGTYEELISRGHDIRSMSMETHDLETHNEDDHHSTTTVSNSFHLKNETSHSLRSGSSSLNDTVVTVGIEHADPDETLRIEHDQISDGKCSSADEPFTNAETEKNVGPSETVSAAFPVKLSSVDDDMTTGAVPKSTYITYFKSVRNPMLIGGMVLSYVLANAAQFFQQLVIAKWTEIGSGNALAQALSAKYLRSLIQAAGVVSVFLWLRSFLTLRLGFRSSTFLHNSLLNAILKAPMNFFDATPSGQLLSRFGKELDVIDRSLPDQIGSVLYCFMQIFFSCAALAGAVTPIMLVPLLMLGFVYTGVISNFRPAAMDLKRCESKSRAPICKFIFLSKILTPNGASYFRLFFENRYPF